MHSKRNKKHYRHRPFRFLWKMKKEIDDTLKKHIDKLVKPIFDKVLKETIKNRTSVGKNNKISDNYSLYNPHNYRLYFDFEKTEFHPLRPTKPTYKTDGGRLGIFNSKEWKTKEQIEGCTIIIKKSCVQINNLIEPKRWYLIQMSDIEKRKQQVHDIHLKKIEQAKKSLKLFIETYGGKSEFKLQRIWCEGKIMKDEPIDKQPLNMFFKAENVKKDYNEPVIEYLGDPIGAANYFSNRGIEDIAPRIASEMNMFNMKLESVMTAVTYIAENYKSHVGMVEEGHKLFKKINSRLSQKKLNEYLY